MTRCRVSEDELAHDHAQTEITPETEREEARAKFAEIWLQAIEMAGVLFQDKWFQPDTDDIEAIQHLHEQLSYYEKVKK